MSNLWKEQFKKEFWDSEISDADGMTCYYLNDKVAEDPSLPVKFISTEIVEKLIDDIPDRWITADDRGELHVGLKSLKQQLRDKWL